MPRSPWTTKLGFAAFVVLPLFPEPSLANPVPETLPPGAIPQQIVPERGEVGIAGFQLPASQQPVLYQPQPVGPPSGLEPSGGDDAATQTMLDQSWGQLAATEAQQLDVSAAALAGTCVMESDCSSDPASHGTISGTFQMADVTYTQMIQEAEERDPALSSTIPAGLAGKTDPSVEAIAASQYMYDAAQNLQGSGISSPTFSQARAYYQFGPSAGTAVATASPDQLISSVVDLTPAQYAANGINPATTTVGEWSAAISNKVGVATANAPVLTSA